MWIASDAKFPGRTVAVKFLRDGLWENEEIRARFDAEAVALGVLDHPNIVTAMDRGEHLGAPYLVMEHVEGATLREKLDARKNSRPPFSYAEVRELYDPVVAALAAAHRLTRPGPIVHRDIKPENVVVREIPGSGLVVKVLDFGIARVGHGQGTRQGHVLGSVRYMAPEQARGDGERVGPWTDVFALGVLLAELFSGLREPSPGMAWWRLSHEPGYDPERALVGLCHDAPAPVRRVIARALALDPARRPVDAGALREALREAWDAAYGPSDTIRVSEPAWPLGADTAPTTSWVTVGVSPSAGVFPPTVPLGDLAFDRPPNGSAARGGAVANARWRPLKLALAAVLLLAGGAAFSLVVTR